VLIDFVERYLFVCDATPRCIPAICDQDINLSILREQLRQLIFDEPNLDRCHVEMADVIAQRQNRVLKPHPQASLAEGIDIGTDDVGRVQGPPHVCCCRFCRPDAEPIVMSGRQAPPSHVRRLRRRGPLVRIESGWTKQISGRCRIAPFAVLKSGHTEVQEHAEAQIHKPLLEILEWQSATQSCAAYRSASLRHRN